MADKKLQIVIDAQNNASREFKKLKRDIKSFSHSYSFETGVIKKASKYAAIGILAVGTAVGALAVKSAFSAARIEELGFVLKAMGKANNLSQKSIDKTVKSLRGMNIAHRQALQVTALFIQSQLKLSDAVKVATAAKDLAVIAGLDSSAATEQLTNAISVQRPMLLRQFGIVKGLDQIYGEYAKTTGLVASQLTEQQKKQAFLNTIVEQGRKVAGTYDAAMGSVSKRYRSLTGRIIPDFIAKVGEAFKPSLNVLVSAFSDKLSNLSDWFDRNKQAVADFGSKLSEWVQVNVNQAINAIKNWYQSVGGAKGIEQAFKNFSNTITEQVIPTVKKTISIIETTIKFLWKYKKAVIAVYTASLLWRAIPAILLAWKVATVAMTGAQWLLNVAMDANPIGATIMLVAGLVAIIYKAIKAMDKWKGSWKIAKNVIVTLFGPLGRIVEYFVDWNKNVDKLKKGLDEIKGAWNKAKKWVTGHRAVGGSVTSGNAYVVGENGPEMFVPSTNGTIEKNVNNSSEVKNVYNFDFSGAVVGDKISLINEIKASISREQELHRLGAI